jgi:type IV secretion system protein VirB4
LFSQHVPWNFITGLHEGVVVQKDGILQRTFAYRGPDVDSSSAAQVNDLCVRVNDFARRLGAGWALHIEAQRFATREYPKADFEYPSGSFSLLAPYLVDREREAAFRAAGRHFESSFYITFSWKPPSESAKKLVQMFVQGGASGSNKSLKENVEYFVNETDSAAAVLSGDMLLRPLDNEETVAYLHSCVSPNRHPVYFPDAPILLDRILPDSELVTSLTMRLGEFWIPIIGVNDFPDETYPAILDLLNRLRLEYRWVSRCICVGKEDGLKEAKKKEKAHRGNSSSIFQLIAAGKGEAAKKDNYAADVKAEDSATAEVEIDTEKAALVYYTTSVMVWARDLATARQHADIVRAAITAAGFTCKEETFNALEAFKAMMPGQCYANYRKLPIMTYTLSHAVPLSSVWAGMGRNRHAGAVSGVDIPHLICSTAEGAPFFMSLNPDDVGHAAVWGPTGSGKSTLLCLLELQFFKYPDSRVIVFDKDRSCRQACLACGGLFYEPASESPSSVSFQPLRDLESDLDLMYAIEFIESLLAVSGKRVTPPISAAVKEALEQLKEKPVSARTLTSFVQYCKYHDPATKQPVVKEWLGDYLWDGGKYGKIFDARNADFSLDTRFLAFEMDGLMKRGDGCVAPALVYLFSLAERMFDGRLTLLVLDEAWLFLRNEVFSAKIAEWLKVLRKKNVFVVFATQDVADVEKSPLKTTIAQQCLTKIYLADKSALSPAMYEVYSAFGLTDSEIGLIASSEMKRDYFYTSPLGRRLFQLGLGPVTLGLVGAADHALLDEISGGRPPGYSCCADILDAKRIGWRGLLGDDAPHEPQPPPAGKSLPAAAPALPAAPPEVAHNGAPNRAAGILAAVGGIPEGRGRNGAGGAAKAIAGRFGVSPATVYQARRVLRCAPPDLLESVRAGSVSIKAAYGRLGRAGNASP